MGSAPDISALPKPKRGAEANMVIADRYRLIRQIGEGGMATVWAAMHLTLDQPVAVKFIEVVGPQRTAIYQRFLREARIAAAVRHRNVVDILDFGTSDDGLPYMAMELLEGRTLGERMSEEEPIPVHEVVRIVARVLSGLGAVHDAGLIHRDLKPENIFLVEDADGVYPKLLDFGVSKAVGRDSTIKSVIPTMENAIVGTPQYMSPEQARGLAEIDQRSDLWSVGVVLFELLTGVLPFDSDAVGDIIIQIATQDPPDFATLRPDLAGAIEDVILRAMSKLPEERFESAREMRSKLLAAVALTAAHLQAAESYDRFEPDTFDTAEPTKLLEAVGDAYEPGDSSLIDFGEQKELIESMRPPPGAPASLALEGVPPPALAPPRAPEVEHDPFAATQDDLSQKRSSSRRLVVVGVIASVAALGTAAGLIALFDDTPERVVAPVVRDEPADPESEAQASAARPGTVTVTIESVPERAEIFVDGTSWTGGADVELPRGDRAHTIEVRMPDGRAWTQEHTADHDGTYTAVLPARHRRGRRRRGSGALIRDPGF